jgi:beta-phosphoglucomutase
MRYKGFIFDMDGTMIDNMMVHHKAWQIILAENGLDLTLEEVQRTIHGKNEEILFRLFGDKFTQKQCQKIAWEKEARYREVFKGKVQLIDGLSEFLETAHNRGIPMSIGTAAPAENVEFVMDSLQFGHYFKGVFHAGMVTKGKPDPEVFLLAAKSMQLDPTDCVVFEDSPTGVHTALNAGCDAIVVLSSHTKAEFERFPNVVAYISSFRSLGGF